MVVFLDRGFDFVGNFTGFARRRDRISVFQPGRNFRGKFFLTLAADIDADVARFQADVFRIGAADITDQGFTGFRRHQMIEFSIEIQQPAW